MKAKHTVSFIIGNGFDIGVLCALEKEFLTSYKEFYAYLSYFLKTQNNSIYEAIRFLDNDSLWVDYELLLENLVENKKLEIEKETDRQEQKKIYDTFIDDWKEIQYKFADFLNYVITPDTLKRVSALKGTKTLGSFLGDLQKEDWEKIAFKDYPRYQSEIEYKIFNFNYSTLADNYFFHLFDRHPYNVSNNNTDFYPNPRGFKGEGYIQKYDKKSLRTTIKFYHPHGQLSIPESILFGIGYNRKTYQTSTSSTSNFHENFGEKLTKKLDKLYWSELGAEKDLEIIQTDLFIIYGHSIGESDKWWWQKILQALARGDAELIIYDYDSQHLKNQIIEYFPDLKESVENKIFVINFDDNTPLNYAFNFKRENARE